MPTFSYKVSKNGKILKGNIEADSKEDLRKSFIKNGYKVFSINLSMFSLFKRQNKLTQKDLICFFSSMSSMDKVGVNIMQSLEMMKDDIATTKSLKEVCKNIYLSVIGGSDLSTACKKSSPSFTDDYVGLIKISESTGNFSGVFDEIVEYIKWSYDIKKRTKSAIIGPTATLFLMLGLIIAMSVLVLPKMQDFLEDLGREIPWYTKSLIVFANFIRTKWYIIGGVITTIIFSIKVISKFNKKVGAYADFLKLKIPILGDLMLKLDTSRFISFFSLMYNSGANILTIISSVSKVVVNKYISYRTSVMEKRILTGETIFQAINNETVFPKMFRKLLVVCEATGEVGSVLANVKFFYDTETKETTDRLVSVIKPLTLIVLGGLVGWMGIAMMMPIYSNIASFGEEDNGGGSAF